MATGQQLTDWIAANPERVRAIKARYRAKNREKLREAGRKRREADPDVDARYYRENRKKVIATVKVYRDSHKEELKRTRAAHLSIPKNRMTHLFKGARNRAKAIGLEFEAGLLAHLLVSPATHCACCGSPLDYTLGQGHNNHAVRSPSLDRLDNACGYTIGNVRVTCLRCNILKKDATLPELEMLVAYMRRR